MTPSAADTLMAEYDDAFTAYRLACRLGQGEQEAFEAWEALRERVIAALHGEQETGRAA